MPSAPKSGKWYAFVWERIQTYGRTLICVGIAFTTFYLLAFALPAIFEAGRASPIFIWWPRINFYILVVHAITAMPPLLTGIVLFSKRIRNASLKWHRWAGTVYCVCIWISATLGIILAVANQNGLIAKGGFGFLGFGWFITTWYAYATGRARDIASHRKWMIRSYALTLAVVSIRPMFIFGPWWGLDNATWYVLVTWLCWVPNLIIAEAYIRVTRNTGKLKYA